MPSLMTGLWPSFEGIPDWNPTTFYGFTDLKSAEEIDRPVLTHNVYTLAEILAGHGWQTAGFNTNPFLSTSHNFQQGFQHYEQFIPELEELRKRSRHELEPAYPPAEIVVAEVEAWLRFSARSPFFAWVHLMDPHSPYLPPPPYNELFLDEASGLDAVELNRGLYHWLFAERGDTRTAERHPSVQSLGLSQDSVVEHAHRLYDGEVRYADAALGKLVTFLRGAGLLERTLLIITADHGEEFGDHGHIFHELQQPAYDELLRIPLLIRFPNGEYAGRKVAQPVRMIDITPSILEILAIEHVADSMDGASLLPTIVGDDTVDRTAFVSAPSFGVVRTGRWKYRFFRGDKTGEQLFDLHVDPNEYYDVLGDNPAIAAEFRGRYEGFAAKLLARGGNPSPLPAGAIPIDAQTREQLKMLGYTE